MRRRIALTRSAEYRSRGQFDALGAIFVSASETIHLKLVLENFAMNYTLSFPFV
jgi:hypothetical protein